MNKKKAMRSFLTGVLTIGIIGGMGTNVFAKTSKDNVTSQQTIEDKALQERIQKLKKELGALGITIAPKQSKDEVLAKLDADTRGKIDSIAKEAKTLKLTPEQAKELRKQRVTLPKKPTQSDKLHHLDADKRNKMIGIFEKFIAGTISEKTAIAELEKLGIPSSYLTELKSRLALINDESKAKALELYKKQKEGSMTKEEVTKERIKLRLK